MKTPRPLPSQRSSARAFSLMELLVAIALIAIVAALLLPSFGRVNEQGLNARCVSHLRLLGAAGLLYAGENGGLLPPRGGWQSPTQNYSIIPYLGLQQRASVTPPYIVDTVLSCPVAQRGTYRTRGDFNRTYALNQYASGFETGAASIITTWEGHVEARGVPIRLGNVRHAAQMAFFMDGPVLLEQGNYRYSVYTAPDRLTPITPAGSASWRTPWVHGEMINVVYLDGHVAPLSLATAQADLISVTNSAGSKRTNPFWGTQK